MKIHFEKLFEVEIYHNFYISGVSEDFVIEPTALCQQKLHNYGLLFKKTPNGFVVLYEVTEDDQGKLHPLRPIDEDAGFSFILLLQKPLFMNYTELPLDNQMNNIYRFHNLNDNQKDDQLLLTSNLSTQFVTPEDRIALRPQFFQYRFQSRNASAVIEVQDEFGASVLQKRVAIVEGVFTYAVDLRSYRPGKFTLKIDGVQQLEFYAGDALIGKNIFAVINIFRNDLVPDDYRFTDKNFDVVAKTYIVKLPRRQTVWKYLVALKYRDAIEPETLSIVSPIPAVQFQRQDVLELPDGTSAVPFVSNQAIPLREEKVMGIKLRKAGGNNSPAYEIENMPNAPIGTLKPDPTENKSFSEIFIYI